jgi:hypothetical protein
MKAGKSLQDLAAELERQAAARRDYIAPQGKVEAVVAETPVGDGNVRRDVMLQGINGGPLAIRSYAHKQLSDVLGIPQRYYDRMASEQPELLARNINTWLRAEPEAKRMIRTVDREVRAVLSPKYRPLDNFELAQAVLPKLINLNVQIMSSELTETRMYIKAILPDLSDDLPAGMTWGNGHNSIAEYGQNRAGKVVAAIVISNSEVGAGTLRIEPSVFTTWCTNLAIMKSAAMKKYHVARSTEATENWEIFRDETRQADDRAFFLKVADITDQAFDRKFFEAAVASIRAAAGNKIGEGVDLQKFVAASVEELALPAKRESTILTYLAQGGDFSQWGLSSAITATANKVEDYEEATDLEHVGGEVLALEQGRWKRILTRAAA